MKRSIYIAFLFWLAVSCTAGKMDDSPLEQALQAAGENREALEKVLAHYSQDPADSLKLQAAIFLIENMPGHYYWGGKTYNQTLVDRVEVTTSTLTTSNVDRRVYEDRWMQPGDVAFFKGFSNEETRATSRFVMPDNVLELSSMSLQYRWDSDWIKKYTGAQSITFSLNINDLFHWGSIKQERGIDYPFARNIQGGIRFLF